jgi:regulator of protease activity HflC (stomatin/prohibitin superfamily)
MENKKFLPLIVTGIVALVIIVYFSNNIFYTLQPGERAVVFKKFGEGLDKDNILIPGFHIIAPWNQMIVYDVKEQKTEETMDVLDKNGLSINVDVSIRYNPMYKKIGNLHETFGINYSSNLIGPEVRSSVRQVMGRYTAEEIYSTKRAEVEADIIRETGTILTNNFIQMRALLIRSIDLPSNIKDAIESKLQQEQEALAYQFKLDKEKSEAERKRIQAEGEARANKIINSSLTTSLLQMRGIEATTNLATSSNSKVVVIGGGGDGLPIILNNN